MTDEAHDQSSSPMDKLRAEFDELLEQMQAPGAQEAMLAALRASPEELAQAAVDYAKRTQQKDSAG